MASTNDLFLILSGNPSSSTTLLIFDKPNGEADIEYNKLCHWLDAFGINQIGSIWLYDHSPSVMAVQIPPSFQKHALTNMLGRHEGLTNSVRVPMHRTICDLRTSLHVIAVRLNPGQSLQGSGFSKFKVSLCRQPAPKPGSTRWDREYPDYPKPTPIKSIPAGVLGLLSEDLWSRVTVQLANTSGLKRSASRSLEGDDSSQVTTKRSKISRADSDDAAVLETMEVDHFDTGMAGTSRAESSSEEGDIWDNLLDEASIFWFT